MAIHTSGMGMWSWGDLDIVEGAAGEGRTVISADTDFGTLLAETAATELWRLLIRRGQDRRAADPTAVILANLPAIDAALLDGAVVVLEEERMRVRRLRLR